jgi:heat shock protein HslJ
MASRGLILDAVRSAAEPDVLPVSPTGEGQGRRRNYRRIVAIAACVAVVVALSIFLALRVAKTSDGSSFAEPLVGLSWQGAEPILTVVFTDDSVRISDGCMSALREVSIGDGVMDIGKPMSPVAICSGNPGGPPADVAAFDAVLDSGHLTWERNGDTLLLANSDGKRVELHVAGTALSLTDQEWALDWFTDSRSESHEGDYTAARLLIGSDGAVQASDLCNELVGSATVTDTAITFTDLTSTGRACIDQAATKVAVAVDQVLSGDVAYSIDGDKLIISGGQRGLLIYTPA